MSSNPEGLRTLETLEEAPNYNAWLAGRFNAHLGNRVLEVGAGIGTITSLIEKQRELLVALEMEPTYVRRMQERFASRPHIRPLQSTVGSTDWEALRGFGFDSILLSNVLEHIEDDVTALKEFRSILQPGGTLVLFVPALPFLFGSIDEAVGHFRRYSRGALSEVVSRAGFELSHLEWMNLIGIPGWFLNNRILKRREVPRGQLRLYDAVAPTLARLEQRVRLPIGMSLFAVARVP